MRRALTASIAIVLLASSAFAVAPGTKIGTLRFADADAHPLALDAPGVLYFVDFWMMGCKPCIVEMPELEKLAKKFEPSGKFRLIRVAWGWKSADLPRLAKLSGVPMPFYADPEDWFTRLDSKGLPSKFLIKDGVVILQHTGGGEGAYERWKKVIEPELHPRKP